MSPRSIDTNLMKWEVKVAEEKPAFDVKDAVDVELESGSSFLLPMCKAKAEIMVGEETAIILFETADGAQLGVPLGHASIEQLHVLLAEALRRLKAGNDHRIQ